MVFKRSEYSREYKQSSLVKNIPTYYDHVSYRTHRRELEYAHTPISWDTDSDDLKSDKNSDQVKNGIESLPLDNLKLAEEEENCSEEETGEKDEEQVECDAEIIEQSQEEAEKKKLAKEKLSKYSSSENKESADKSKLLPPNKSDDLNILRPKKVEDELFIKKSDKRRAKEKRSKRVTSSRPKTAPATRSSTDTEKRSPFLLYGCGVSERTTGTQRTHNVRSSTDVYPAALKAYRRHQAEARKRQDADLQAALKAKRKKILLNQKMERDRASWVSEYVHRYPTYDSTEYAKSWDRVKRCQSVFSV